MNGTSQEVLAVFKLTDGHLVRLACGHHINRRYAPAIGSSAECHRCFMRERDRDKRRNGK